MAFLPRIAPMLATPGKLPPAPVDDAYAYEAKQDGQRCIVYLPGDGSLVLRSRSGADITPAYPELAGLGTALGSRPAVLDGEIVALDGEGRSDFERLQSRMGLAGSPARAARMATKIPAHLMLFDIVFLDTQDLTRTPYSERRTALESLDLAGAAWSTPAAVVGHGRQALEMTRTAGLEGLVVNSLLNLRVEAGQQGGSWCQGGVSTGCRRDGSSRRPACRRCATGRTWRSARYVQGSGQALRFCCRPTARSTDG